MLHDRLPCDRRICSEPAALLTPAAPDDLLCLETAFPYCRSYTSGAAEELCTLQGSSRENAQLPTAEEDQLLSSTEQLAKPTQGDTSIDDLLDQLLKISRHSPPASLAESTESLRSGVAQLPSPGILDYRRLGAIQDCYGQQFVLPQEWQGRIAYESAELMAQFNSGAEMDLTRAEGQLNAEEESGIMCTAAICAMVPKLVRVSMNRPVRGVYLDRRRGLWRANWRENGRVKTKGFRIAQWGEHEARRKAVEVRKLMETRACFLRLKAVAFGTVPMPGMKTKSEGATREQKHAFPMLGDSEDAVALATAMHLLRSSPFALPRAMSHLLPPSLGNYGFTQEEGMFSPYAPSATGTPAAINPFDTALGGDLSSDMPVTSSAERIEAAAARGKRGPNISSLESPLKVRRLREDAEWTTSL